jgi:hypothetical protein
VVLRGNDGTQSDPAARRIESCVRLPNGAVGAGISAVVACSIGDIIATEGELTISP